MDAGSSCRKFRYTPLKRSPQPKVLNKEGFTKESLSIIEKLFPNLISITTQEQDELASNIISLGNKVVIVQKRHNRIIEELTNLGFTIETMDIYDTIEEIGYNRCLTCPLEREKE